MISEEKQFENEVLQIARSLWPESKIAGQTLIAGRERDGVFITEDSVHLIECTTSRKKDKAVEDGKKLWELIEKMRVRYPSKGVKGWFITREEPTADQRAAITRPYSSIYTCSINEFRRKLIDVSLYLSLRSRYSFGSMQDLSTGSRVIPDRFTYVDIDLVSSLGEKWNAASLANSLLGDTRIVLLGDFGIGKSTTMREVFFKLKQEYEAGTAYRFPVLVNLRDHHGQKNPAEALERHARDIGYDSPSHLVRAWRAGYVVLLLDGFDELAIAGWTGQAQRLKRLRLESMTLIRKFVEETPSDVGLAISGRAHYFDNRVERVSALGLNGRPFVELDLNDFNEEQIRTYLQSRGWSMAIPSWFPARPLLLGYLAAKNLLEPIVEMGETIAPAAGWDALLRNIGEREAGIEVGIDGETVRLVIERLASKARSTKTGLGPLQTTDMITAFTEVCGYAPDDKGMLLLQRLPGLGNTRAEDGSRDFIDYDFVSAAQSGDIFRYAIDPHSNNLTESTSWDSSCSWLGCQVAAHLCQRAGLQAGQLSHAAEVAVRRARTLALAADIIEVMRELSFSYEGRDITISDIEIPTISIDTSQDMSSVNYKDCYIRNVDVEVEFDENRSSKFSECYVGLLEGRTSRTDVPRTIFDDKCIIDAYGESVQTSASIMSSSLPLGVQALLTVLKKLFRQRGRARVDSALTSGLHSDARQMVPSILSLLVSEGIVTRATAGKGTIWVPARSQTERVEQIMNSPTTSQDCILIEARSMK